MHREKASPVHFSLAAGYQVFATMEHTGMYYTSLPFHLKTLVHVLPHQFGFYVVPEQHSITK